MTKQSGLGQNLYVDSFNISGDVGAIDSLSGPQQTFDMTGIDKSAHERIGAQRSGALGFTAFYNPSALQAHPALSTLPLTDRVVTWTAQGTSIGNAAVSMVAKQLNYDWKREDSGALKISVEANSNGYGIEWGQMLTAGLRTDTAATSPATGLDTLASASFGGQAYLHVTAFTGTSVAIKIQDSADNSTFADISPTLLFTTVTGVTSERISVANTTTIRRYVRVITTGTFSNAVFAVNFVKNVQAVVF